MKRLILLVVLVVILASLSVPTLGAHLDGCVVQPSDCWYAGYPCECVCNMALYCNGRYMSTVCYGCYCGECR